MAGEFYISGLSGTRFDYKAFLDKYKELKSIPVQMMQSQIDDIKAKNEALSAIRSKLSALFAPALDLTLDTTYETKKATLSNPDIASVSVSNDALNGTYSLTVNSLAESSKWRIDGTSTITDIDAKFTKNGSLTINYKKDGTSTSLTIDYTNKSLREIVNEINNSDDLEATIINVGDSSNPDYRMIVKSKNTGTANEITGISDSLGSSGVFDDSNSEQVVAAVDASITLDGIDITSPTNTFTGVISGVDITVKETGSTTITVSNDYSNIKQNVESILDGYNKLKETIRLATSREQPLQGEASLNSIATGLLGIISSYLGKYGLLDTSGDAETTRGLLKLKEDVFNEFVQKPDAKEVLQNLGRAIEDYVNNFSDSLHIKAQKYQESAIRIKERIDYMTKRIDEQIESMRLRFVKLESYMAQMQALQLKIQNFANSFGAITTNEK